jgi:hypothetical protein
VSARSAKASKRTTTTREVVGGKSANKQTVTRDLSNGRFVAPSRGKSDPNGTMQQRV